MADRSDRDRLTLALKRAIEDKFDASDWQELGLLTGSTEYLDRHPRLYRSLSFGDPDYGTCIVQVLPEVLGPDLEHLDAVLDFVDLDEWLRHNDPRLHARLFASVLRLDADDLSALPDRAAIEAHLTRLDAAVEADPELAVGVAKELIESTVKLVLQQLDVSVDETADLPKLAKEAQKALGLHPGALSPDRRGVESTKKVLGGLTSIAVGIAELRNLYGTGHGRTTPTSGIKPRHARMAVDASTTYCRALLATLADPGAPWRRTSR